MQTVIHANTYSSHSITNKRDASLAGIPMTVKMKRVVTVPVAGIPASPTLDTATVALQRKHRHDHESSTVEDIKI